jgi:conserved oligomeric Golgi complex subunit 2
VRERRLEVENLLFEKKGVSKEIALGRKLLEVDARLEELEDRLMVASLGRTTGGLDEESWSESEDDEDNEDDLVSEGVVSGASTRKLQSLVADCRYVENLSASIGKEHPFIAAQEPRILRARNTILLDLSTAVKQAASVGEGGKARVISILSIYRDLGAGDDAVKVLKDLQQR